MSHHFNLIGAQVLSRGSYPSGTGLIYLTELECDGSESSLSSCQTGLNVIPGLVNCDHSMDVNIQCQGNTTCAQH